MLWDTLSFWTLGCFQPPKRTAETAGSRPWRSRKQTDAPRPGSGRAAPRRAAPFNSRARLCSTSTASGRQQHIGKCHCETGLQDVLDDGSPPVRSTRAAHSGRVSPQSESGASRTRRRGDIRSARAPLGVRFQSIDLFIAAWRYGTRLQKLGAFRYTEQWLFLLTECHLIS